MFPRLSSFCLLAVGVLPVLAAASAVPRTDSPVNQCNTGPIQCCNSVQDPKNPVLNPLLGLLGIVVGPITGLVGLNCAPISVIGTGDTSCTSHTVCCSNNQYNGLINFGCSPTTIKL